MRAEAGGGQRGSELGVRAERDAWWSHENGEEGGSAGLGA